MNIDISFAKALVSNYGQYHWQLINNTLGKFIANPLYPNIKDSRSVWFSVATLRAFLDEIQPVAGTQATGVRIYFGEYCPDTLGQITDPLIDGLHTLIMIPTKLMVVDGLEHDIDIATGTTDFKTLPPTATITALNHGTCVPPPYKMSGQGSMYEQGTGFMKYADDNFIPARV
jgi:hypothetical protein